MTLPGTAFVDTSVLTDALLKRGAKNTTALAALKAFPETQLPVFAIKEFKAGPLKYWTILHNKLLETGSLPQTIGFIQSCFMKPSLVSTCLEALKDETLWRTLAKEDLKKAHGSVAGLDSLRVDSLRLAVKTRILIAWKKRRAMTSKTVCGLTCYSETAPSTRGQRIGISPYECRPPAECGLAPGLKSSQGLEALRAFRRALQSDGRRETAKRLAALRTIIKRPGDRIGENLCRALGDAVFAFQAPAGSAILTTNLRDHKPLAEAVGKTAVTPAEVVATMGQKP